MRLRSGRVRKFRKSEDDPGHAHELTFCCYKRLPLLNADRTRHWLVEALEHIRKIHHVELWAWPSIGLHARDNKKLLDSLCRLRDIGNTVIVVEHDEQTMRTADEIVDFGPGPGVRGGKIVAHGDLEQIRKSRRSITGQYLRGEKEIAMPKERRPVSRRKKE